MKKKIIVCSILIGVLLILCSIIMVMKVKIKKQKEQADLLKMQSINAERMLKDLGATGEVDIQDDKVVITNLVFDETGLLIKINYYNVKTESTITLDQIEEQLKSCEFSDGNMEELVKLCDFIEENVTTMDSGSEYSIYLFNVYSALEDMQTDINTATREQLEEACQKALEE